MDARIDRYDGVWMHGGEISSGGGKMLSVQTNMPAGNASRQFGIITGKNAKSTEKLSSGYRINRAADDAAGLAISERMRRQIRGLTQAASNAQDGISMLQSAEGALNEVHDMLHRANELAVKAATGTLTDDDRAMIDMEVQQVKQEIDDTAEHTVFNEIRLFPDDGPLPSLMPSEIYYYDLTYNLADGTFSIDQTNSSLAGGVTGRAAVNPTPSGGALADVIATEFIPKAAAQILDAFPSIKNDIGSGTLGIAIKVQKIDGRDKQLAQAYFTYSRNGGRPKILELRIDNQDFTLADAQGTGGRAEVLQSTIAHELMHSFMQYSMTDGMSGRKGSRFPEWFTEGTAQLSGGGFPTNWNNALISYARQLADENDSSQDANIISYLKRYTPDNRPYGHGYLAAAYAGWLANGGGDVTSANIAAGMDKIFADLINGSTVNQAISKYTGLTETQLKNRITSGSAVEFVRKLSFNSLGGAGSVITSSLKVSGVIDGSVSGGGGTVTPIDPLDPANRPIGGNSAGGSKGVALQVGAEAGQHIGLSLYQMNTRALGVADTNVKTVDDADAAIDAIKAAIASVSRVRSDYGAIQNRLEHTINNLNNIVENTAAAESVIRDTDIAGEMVRYSNNQILMQAGSAILSQANRQTEMILSLLG